MRSNRRPDDRRAVHQHPDYGAPEQISGASVDGRTNQYALACVTYELLTGSVPFKREDPMMVLYAHAYADPPSLTAARPDLPAAVDTVLARGLAKQPDRRYDSRGDFADALREATAGHRPDRPARRPGHLAPARGAAQGPRRHLVRHRPRLSPRPASPRRSCSASKTATPPRAGPATARRGTVPQVLLHDELLPVGELDLAGMFLARPVLRKQAWPMPRVTRYLDASLLLLQRDPVIWPYRLHGAGTFPDESRPVIGAPDRKPRHRLRSVASQHNVAIAEVQPQQVRVIGAGFRQRDVLVAARTGNPSGTTPGGTPSALTPIPDRA